MSATDGHDELDANRDRDALDSPPPSAASPSEIEPTEAEPANDVEQTDVEQTDVPEPTTGTALSDDPVLSSDPQLPNEGEYAPTASSAPEFTTASAELDAHPTPDQATTNQDRNWPGYVAFTTGALALSIPAIVLGHLGLSASKRGRTASREFALAGLILGYIALVATGVGLWFLSTDRTPPATLDVYAQQDVSAVGAAAATAAIETGQMPEVTLTDTGYMVAGQALDTHLMGERTLNVTGEGMAGWCLDIGYDGGEQAAFSYTATTGMAQGRCGG